MGLWIAQEILFHLIAVTAPYQAFKVCGFDHVLVLLFDFFAIVLAAVSLLLWLEFDTEDADWVRVMLVKAHLLTLDTMLKLVCLNI